MMVTPGGARVADLLGAEEEARLCLEAQAGSEAAEQQLLDHNWGLVRAMAARWTSPWMEFDDAAQEAALGFVVAVRRFRPELGCRLSTFAIYWMRQSLSRAVEKKSRLIRVPSHAFQEWRAVRQVEARLREQLGSDPTPEAVCAELAVKGKAMTPARLAALQVIFDEPLSLSKKLGSEDQTYELGGVLNDKASSFVNQLLTDLNQRHVLGLLLVGLTDRAVEVVRRKFGLEPYEVPQSMAEIGRDLGCSRENVRQTALGALLHCRRRVQLLEIELEDLL